MILGVGVAALAGTLLSVISPTEVQSPAPTASNVETSAAPSGPSRSRSGLTTPITLARSLDGLQAEIEELVSYTPGLAQSVFLLDLDTGNYVNLNGGEALPAASTIKVPILVAFLQAVDAGTVTLDQEMVMQSEQIVGGSGDMQVEPPGSSYSALEVATQMIINSDNTATNMVIDLLGGQEALNQMFRGWGLSSTVLRNPLPDLDGTNTTSTQDLVTVMAMVERGDLLTLRSRDRMMSIMQRTYTRTLIPAGLEDSAIAANKTGDIGEVLGDVALVDTFNGRRYIMSSLVTRPHNDGRARELIRQTSQRAYQEMNRPLSSNGTPTESGGLDQTRQAVPQG
jgi:beta-lactamase class A